MQEGPQQKGKLINEGTDSLVTLLLKLVGVLLQQHHATLLTVFAAGLSVDEYSTVVATISVVLSPDLPTSLMAWLAAALPCAKVLTRLWPGGDFCSDVMR